MRDPFVGMAFILSLMAEERKPFSQLVAELPRYAMLKTKFEVPREKAATSFAALEKQLVRCPHQPRGRPAARWPRLVAPCPRQQHRAGRAGDCRAPTEDRAKELCDAAGAIVTGKPAPRRAKAEPAVSGKKPARKRRGNAD